MIELIMLLVLADGSRHAHATTQMECLEWAGAMASGSAIVQSGDSTDPANVVIMAMCLPADLAAPLTRGRP